MNVTIPIEIVDTGNNGFHYAAHPHVSASHYGTTPAAKKKIRAEIQRTVDAALETHAHHYESRAIFAADGSPSEGSVFFVRFMGGCWGYEIHYPGTRGGSTVGWDTFAEAVEAVKARIGRLARRYSYTLAGIW